MDKVLTGIVADIAQEYNTNIHEVEKVLNMPYKMMRENIQALELRGRLYEDIKDQNNKISDEFWDLYKSEFKKDLHSLKITIEKFNKLIESKNKDATTETN